MLLTGTLKEEVRGIGFLYALDLFYFLKKFKVSYSTEGHFAVTCDQALSSLPHPRKKRFPLKKTFDRTSTVQK